MDFEQQLRTAFAPCDPRPELRSTILARRSALVRSGGKSGSRSRTILLGSIVAVAAAAAMLAARLMDQPAIQPVATVPAQESAPVSAVVADALPPLASPAPELAQEKAAPVEAVPAVKPFTVSVRLQNQAKDAAIPAVESFYAALLDNLRAVPGLTLIEQAQGGAAPTAAADYRLMVTGTGPVADNKFSIVISENPMELPGAGTIGRRGFGSAGGIADPVGLVASMTEFVRSEVLPPDPAYKQRLQVRLLDSTQDPRQRMKALTGLFSLGRAPAGSGALSLDSASLRGAIDLAASTTDPELRAQVWRTLRGVRNAELVPALSGSLRDDSSVEVRLEALATLSAYVRDDARARTTLESVAREDARPMLRALAQRALTGDAAWKQYIVSSLQDTTRPVAERIEAFAYQMYGMSPGSNNNYGTGDPKILNDEMIQALSQVLPEAAKLPNMVMLKLNVPRDLMAAGPAGVVALLEMVKQSTEPGFRSTIVNQLTQSSGDPRVRTALETISAEDPDPQLRQAAADVLKNSGPMEANISAGLGMVLGMLKQKDVDPGLRSSLTRQLTERSRDPRWRAALERISTSDPDAQLRELAADVLKSAAAQ